MVLDVVSTTCHPGLFITNIIKELMTYWNSTELITYWNSNSVLERKVFFGDLHTIPDYNHGGFYVYNLESSVTLSWFSIPETRH